MRFMLLAGVAFWSTITFLGVRKAYKNGGKFSRTRPRWKTDYSRVHEDRVT